MCLLAKAVEPDWILWRLLRYSKTFWRVLLEDWRGFDWRLTGWSRTWNSAKKEFKVPTLPLFQFFFSFFLSKDWWKTKRNPSKPKVVYLKKYRFHARKVEDSEHAIYDVCERVRCGLTESRPPAVRRPALSQIKMYGFCRLFRAMFACIEFAGNFCKGSVAADPRLFRRWSPTSDQSLTLGDCMILPWVQFFVTASFTELKESLKDNAFRPEQRLALSTTKRQPAGIIRQGAEATSWSSTHAHANGTS